MRVGTHATEKLQNPDMTCAVARGGPVAGALSALRNVRAHHIHPHYTTELEVTRRARAEHTEVQNEIPPAAIRETTHCNNQQEHNDKTTPFLSMSVMALQGDRLLRGAQPAECRKEGPVRPNGRLSFRRASHFSFM